MNACLDRHGYSGNLQPCRPTPHPRRLGGLLLAGLVLGGCASVDNPPAAGEGAPAALPIPALSVPAHMVATGNAAPLIRHNRHLRGGGHTQGAFSGGWQVTHALAVRAGQAEAEAKLLEQIRSSLEGENCLSANGGYPAQHERHLTGAYTLVKGSDFWNRALSEPERHKITLLMKAALVASAYTTADASYDRPITALDGDPNLNRGWNPNFREGIFGALIHTTVFFGGVEAVRGILDSYDHEAFVAELAAAGLDNTHETFTWARNHPDSGAPDGARITRCIREYRCEGQPLRDPMQLLHDLTIFTYGGTVSCGLNDGAGILWEGVPTGAIAAGCEGLPNKGWPGMLLEFAARDAGGPRSSIHYAYDGFRPNLTNHLVVVTGGYWQPGPQADAILALLPVGITDLEYKLRHGYRDYAKAKGHPGVFSITAEHWQSTFGTTLPLWSEILRPFHGL